MEWRKIAKCRKRGYESAFKDAVLLRNYHERAKERRVFATQGTSMYERCTYDVGYTQGLLQGFIEGMAAAYGFRAIAINMDVNKAFKRGRESGELPASAVTNLYDVYTESA